MKGQNSDVMWESYWGGPTIKKKTSTQSQFYNNKLKLYNFISQIYTQQVSIVHFKFQLYIT